MRRRGEKVLTVLKMFRSRTIAKRKIVASASILVLFMVSISILRLPERITMKPKMMSTNLARISTDPTRKTTNPPWLSSNPPRISANPPKISVNPQRISANPRKMSKGALLLLVGIHSAPSRLDRRNAIRETWWKECQSNPNAVCRFFTDGQDPNGKVLQGEKRMKLENEIRVHGDLLLTQVPGGVNFALKYLWMLQWAKESYDFQYFLRLDDDYFICFRKLMLELEFFRPKEKFQWGWLHCELKVATWLDEAFYLVSKDIVESFLSRRDTLVCHVWESQAIGYWLQNISNLTTFADNKRILHTQLRFSSEQEVLKRTEICHSALAIHKSYPGKMRMFWSIYEKEDKSIIYQVPSVSYSCIYPLAMDYRTWSKESFWFSEPKLCKDNPIWNRIGEYKGQQGH